MEDSEMEELQRMAEQCNKSLEVPPSFKGLYCPGRFDGWTCWPHTPAGHTVNASCPSFIVGFEASNTVFYKCEEEGSWTFYESQNRTWVNYTTCVNVDDYKFRNSVLTISTVGCSLSLVALLLSLALLLYFKSLRCARILIHMNLFASFAITNFLWLIWTNFVLQSVTVLQENPAWCTIINNLFYGSLISNYSWMLCEGLYLHTVLVWAFVSQSRLLFWMLFIGWGLPVLDMLIYVPLRLVYGTKDELNQCWVNESQWIIVQQVLVTTAVIANCLFLTNIVRVLVIKLRRGPANDGSGSGASRASLQALRATLLLVPLLGVNYLLTPVRPDKTHPWEHAYEIVSAIITSFQGLCVAILFCFCNGEVQAQIKRKWNIVMFRPRQNSCTVTTVSFVRNNYPTNGEEKV